MNITVIIIVAILAIALIIFLIKRNVKDETEFEEQLKNDYSKPKHDHADADPEEMPQ
ncbi:MAG: hypothetical protein RL172_2294 [Bacteroidota bacterium]|jgi:uncharacterized membrane protein YukC